MNQGSHRYSSLWSVLTVLVRLYSMEITIGFIPSSSMSLARSSTSTSSTTTEDHQSGTTNALTAIRVGRLLYHGHGEEFVIASDETFQLGVDTTQLGNPFKGELISKYPVSLADSVRPKASITLGCGVSRVDGHIFYTKDGVMLGMSCLANVCRPRAACSILNIGRRQLQVTHAKTLVNSRGRYCTLLCA